LELINFSGRKCPFDLLIKKLNTVISQPHMAKWRSEEECLEWDEKVAGSNPVRTFLSLAKITVINKFKNDGTSHTPNDKQMCHSSAFETNE
jgi:hypothetical protein